MDEEESERELDSMCREVAALAAGLERSRLELEAILDDSLAHSKSTEARIELLKARVMVSEIVHDFRTILFEIEKTLLLTRSQRRQKKRLRRWWRTCF
jgi:hypothetical protein